MLQCLNKVVNQIDTFQEDCAKMIFALRHLLGEDLTVNENDLYLKEEDEGLCVYRNKDLVLTYSEEGMIAAPKFSRQGKILKEALKLAKKGLEETASPDHGVDGQQLGGMPKDTLGEEEQKNQGWSKEKLLYKAKEAIFKTALTKKGKEREDLLKLLDNDEAIKQKYKISEEDNIDLRSKVEKFLKQFPNPQDNMVHGLAKKLGVSTDEIEEVFYQIASDAVADDEEPIDEDGGTSVADVAVNPNGLEEKPKKKKLVKEALFKVNAYNDMSGATTGSGTGTSPNAARQGVKAAAARPGTTVGRVQEL